MLATLTFKHSLALTLFFYWMKSMYIPPLCVDSIFRKSVQKRVLLALLINQVAKVRAKNKVHDKLHIVL